MLFFSIKKFKKIWSTSFLITIKKNQWRNYIDVQFVKQIWNQYNEYLLSLFNNSTIRVINTITQFENISQNYRQNVVVFNQYLNNFWNKLKHFVNDAKRRKKLLTKIIVFIRIKYVNVKNNKIDFYIQLISNLMIAKQLFVDGDIIKKSSNNVKKTKKKK